MEEEVTKELWDGGRNAFSDKIESIESFLIGKGLHEFRKEVHHAKSLGYRIKGFYHASVAHGDYDFPPGFKIVVEDHLRMLDGQRKQPNLYRNLSVPGATEQVDWWTENEIYLKGPSLLDASDELYINEAVILGASPYVEDFVKSIRTKINSFDKITFHTNQTLKRKSAEEQASKDKFNISIGEFSTVQALQNYCVDEVSHGRKSLVYYFHTKASNAVTRPNTITSWRDIMNAFILEFPSICIKALVRGNFSTCGTIMHPRMYGGNFWWSHCDHIAAMPKISLNKRFDYMYAEKFIFDVAGDNWKLNENFGYYCGYVPENIGFEQFPTFVDLFRSLYRNRLVECLQNESVLPTGVIPYSYDPLRSRIDLCVKLREGNSSYSSPEKQKLVQQITDLHP
eukprot:gene17591-24433_t